MQQFMASKNIVYMDRQPEERSRSDIPQNEYSPFDFLTDYSIYLCYCVFNL